MGREVDLKVSLEIASTLKDGCDFEIDCNKLSGLNSGNFYQIKQHAAIK